MEAGREEVKTLLDGMLEGGDMSKALGCALIALDNAYRGMDEYLDDPNPQTRGKLAGSCAVAHGALDALANLAAQMGLVLDIHGGEEE